MLLWPFGLPVMDPAAPSQSQEHAYAAVIWRCGALERHPHRMTQAAQRLAIMQMVAGLVLRLGRVLVDVRMASLLKKVLE